MKHNFDTNHKTLVMCFSGQSEFDRQEGGRFEWVEFFKDKSVKTLHLRDYFQSYYMGNWYDESGNTIAGGVTSHIKFLSEIIDESGCDRVVTTGVSMGAFAAVLYGVLLDVECVLAFNAQTHISRNSPWFPRLVGSAFDHAISEDTESYFDLAKLNYEKFNGKIYYHWGTHEADVDYMNYMKGFCEKHPHLGGRNTENSTDDAKIHIQNHGIYAHGNLCGRLKKLGQLAILFERDGKILTIQQELDALRNEFSDMDDESDVL
jgi:hypothetical protein